MSLLIILSLLIGITSIQILDVSAQNETVNSLEMNNVNQIKKENPELTAIEWITLASVIVNVVLVFFIFWTYRENKNQFISLNRPWLNIRVGKMDLDGNCEFIIKNHGNLPCHNMNITYKNLKTKNSEIKEIYSPIHSLMPSQEQNFFLPIVDTSGYTTSDNVMHVDYSFDVDLIINYSYGKNSKKIIFQISEDTSISDDGPYIQTKHMD